MAKIWTGTRAINLDRTVVHSQCYRWKRYQHLGSMLEGMGAMGSTSVIPVIVVITSRWHEISRLEQRELEGLVLGRRSVDVKLGAE